MGLIKAVVAALKCINTFCFPVGNHSVSLVKVVPCHPATGHHRILTFSFGWTLGSECSEKAEVACGLCKQVVDILIEMLGIFFLNLICLEVSVRWVKVCWPLESSAKE